MLKHFYPAAIYDPKEILRLLTDLYFASDQQLMGRPLRDFAPQCITETRKIPITNLASTVT